MVLFLTGGIVRSQTAGSPPEARGSSSLPPDPIRTIVEEEIQKEKLPGAVVLVGSGSHIRYLKAFGNRSTQPNTEPMTADTIFDLASLTKPVATATSIMILVERGKLRLADPVAKHIPQFGVNGKETITVEHLLTHRSGLIADNPIEDYQQGTEKAFENIDNLKTLSEPGTKFLYSDVNFIVLGELVRRLSGQPLDVFAADNIFKPLGMTETGFRPAENLKTRIAPTDQRGEGDKKYWIRGEVHDPRAFLLGGVAGHAGLFSTALDLARFCRMMLNGGQLEGKRILSPLSVARMTQFRPATNAADSVQRGLGWDINSPYSSNRGDLFPIGSFGHTGFTGTSIWIDPASETFVIFLSNRVHLKNGDVTALRGRVATIAASEITNGPFESWDATRFNQFTPIGGRNDPGFRFRLLKAFAGTANGIDVLERQGFQPLKGKRVGLITNHTGRTADGRSTIDVLFKAPDVKLVALFSPEHGIRGVKDEKVENSTDEKTGLPIFSLYGETRQPTPKMLEGIDVLVFDIQDIGTRFYTYISTMGLAMEAAAKANIEFVVLDRVNPITGTHVEGPIADPEKFSFIAFHGIPVRHGMTVGELARLFNAERRINARLTVIEVSGWERGQWFDETGLTWVNPSPNMRSLTEATLYPGIGLLEMTDLSVGRGTDTPFEVIGAPWIDERTLAAEIKKAEIPGLTVVPVRFTPKASVHKDKECGGVNLVITDRDRFNAVECGLELAFILKRLYPKEFDVAKLDKLLADKEILARLASGSPAGEPNWSPELETFKKIRERYLMYK